MRNHLVSFVVCASALSFACGTPEPQSGSLEGAIGAPTTPSHDPSQASSQQAPPSNSAAPTPAAATTVVISTPAAPPAPATPATPATPAVAEPPLVSMTEQFSSLKSDWIMSRTANEGAPEYHYNGVQFRVFDTPPSDAPAEPLYRCFDSAGTHFQTNDFNCEGVGTFESLLGYVYISDPGNGAMPIARCIGASGAPIVATLRLADCNPFIVQNIQLGWAFDASVETAPPAVQ